MRMVKVPDEKAIQLGNYDVKDLETGGKRRIDPVATARRIPFEKKQELLDKIIQPDKTLNEGIRDNFGAVVNHLDPYLNGAQKVGLLRNGEPTPAGLEDIQNLVKHFLFDGGDANLPEQFDALPYNTREGINKA